MIPRLTKVFIIREEGERDDFVRRLLPFYHESEAESIVDDLIDEYGEEEAEEYVGQIEKQKKPTVKKNPSFPYDPWDDAFKPYIKAEHQHVNVDAYDLHLNDSANFIPSDELIQSKNQIEHEAKIQLEIVRPMAFHGNSAPEWAKKMFAPVKHTSPEGKMHRERVIDMLEYVDDVIIPSFDNPQSLSRDDGLVLYGLFAMATAVLKDVETVKIMDMIKRSFKN